MSDVVLQMVLAFLERQIIKFGQGLDWDKVKADVKVRIEQIVPNTVFDAVAEVIVNALIDLVANYFKSQSVPITKANLGQALAVAQASLPRELASRIAGKI